MAFTIVRVASGGIPVVESDRGLPYYEADNGYGIPVTFGSTGIPLGTASGPALNYSPILWITGDSQALGTLSTSDQAAAVAAYVPTAKVKTLNASGAFVTYTPDTITGLDFSSNKGNVGTEIGFISAFRAAFPNDTLYIVKDAASGSYQTRGSASATALRISGTAANTYSLVSGTLIGGNTLIIGTGIETGVYIPFTGFLAKVGVAGGRTGSTLGANIDVTQYNGTLSWSATEGLAYNGNSANINNGARARLVAARALLTSPKIIAHVHNIGSNDAGLTDASAFATDLDNMYTRFGADITNYSTDAKTVLVRSTTGKTSSTTVRAAQQAKADGSASIFLLDTDSYTKWDGTHWNLAAHTDMGNKVFGIWQGTYSGI